MGKVLNDNWEYNVFDIYNYNTQGKLDIYYRWIIENHKNVEGDILEAGVFRGKSILATALLLKELGSDKKVYGFDSFSGFPPIYHENDNLLVFERLYQEGQITKDHFDAHKKLKKYRTFLKGADVSVKNISSSTDFSDASEAAIRKKAEFLGLDNIELVKGDFNSTMKTENFPDMKLMAALMDCDLYSSYKVSLPFIWDNLQPGGYLYIDEYYSLKFPGARIACDEFFNERSEKPQMAPRAPGEFERWYVTKNL